MASQQNTRYATAMELLTTTKVRDLCSTQKLITVVDTESAKSAFKKLIDHGILSMPMYDKARGRYTAFIDTIDILVHVLNAFSKEGTNVDDIDFEEHLDIPVSRITDISNRNPFKPVEDNAPMLIALKLCSQWRTHRIPVIDAGGTLLSILSQSAIIPWVYKNLSLFAIKDKTVGELKLGYKSKVIAASTTQLAAQAMVTIRDHGVSGLAVVDEKNRLVGNISASDLKNIGYDGQLFKKLFLTVGEFIANREPIYVTPTTTVAEVIRIFNDTKVHRLYVIHGDRQILGVISLFDLIECIVNSVENPSSLEK